MKKITTTILHLAALTLATHGVLAQTGDVTATLVFHHNSSPTHKASQNQSLGNVVLWLTPIDPASPVPNTLPHSGYKLVQKEKMFIPHLLVVPTGSSVDFPNLDPFFHNVFSLFNGKRFDLGLYETGNHRTVRFDREGVSYIFCNIHPEMGAVVIALASPWFALSSATGDLAIHNVPPGHYRVHIWSEHFEGSAPDRVIEVTPQGASLGTIDLLATPDPITHHLNKFGEGYAPDAHPTY